MLARHLRRWLCWMPLLAVTPAAAQQALDWALCANDGNAYPAEKAINGCTAVIKAGRETRKYMAIAYYDRGNAYYNIGDIDQAITDYTSAIRLNPQYVSALSNRGNAYGSKGDLDGAFADYSAALLIDPALRAAIANRAEPYLAKGDVDRAIADYN